jgi:hypothetical protein
MDTGSTITTMGTNGELSSYVQPSTSGIKMRSATGQVVLPAGEGDITLQKKQALLVLKCQHTPAIGSNILSTAETCDTLDYDLYSLTCNRRTAMCQVQFEKKGSPDITLQGTYSNRMPYIWVASSLATVTYAVPMTSNFLSITDESLSVNNDDAVHQVLRILHSSSPANTSTPADCRFALFQVFGEKLSDDWTHSGSPGAPVMHVSDVVNRTLWYMRTCHPNPARLVLLSKLAKGMPNIKHPQDIEECSECLIAKMRKAAHGHTIGVEATSVGQGLVMYVGFMFQTSKNKHRATRLMGINSCNVYCLLYDFYSELLFGVTMRGKCIPLTWLHVLLTRIAPKDHPGRIVRLDLDGETGKNPEIAALFLKHHYILQPTGAGASSPNRSGQLPHSTIGNALRAMLYSADLLPKFWEYIFYFYLRVHTVLPHGKNKLSPYHLVKGAPADISNIRTFGCLMYAISTKRRDAKLTKEKIIRAKFLGYGGSMKTFIYYNIKTNKRGRATHTRFDEAQLSASPGTLSPNSHALWGDLQHSPGTDAPDIEAIVTPPEKFCVFTYNSPFLQVRTVLVNIRCTFYTFGLVLETDPMSHWNLVLDVTPLSSASHLDWTTQLQFHTMIQIDETPVYTVDEVLATLSTLANVLHECFHLIGAPYKPDANDQQSPLPQVALDQLRVVHHVLHGWDLEDPILLVTAENADTMAKGTHHTRRICLKGPKKDKWMEAEFDMLDKNDSYGMYGTAVKRRNIPSTANIVRPIWNYSKKGNGVHKARKCMDGK